MMEQVFGESKITEYTVQENPMGPGKTEVQYVSFCYAVDSKGRELGKEPRPNMIHSEILLWSESCNPQCEDMCP